MQRYCVIQYRAVLVLLVYHLHPQYCLPTAIVIRGTAPQAPKAVPDSETGFGYSQRIGLVLLPHLCVRWRCGLLQRKSSDCIARDVRLHKRSLTLTAIAWYMQRCISMMTLYRCCRRIPRLEKQQGEARQHTAKKLCVKRGAETADVIGAYLPRKLRALILGT
jgi:hypothetical protein